MFSSCFMLFPTLKKKRCKKKFGGGGGCGFFFLEKQFFLIKLFTFYAIFNIKKILKSAPSLTG